MIVKCDPFDTIVIVIILDTLYRDFKTIIVSILETGVKTIKEI